MFLGMALVYCPGLMHMNGLAVPQPCRLSASDICAKSAKWYAGLRSSGCNLIINVHCSGESACKIDEFINNLLFLFIHSDGWFTVRLSRCWLVYYLSLFVLIVS